MVKINYENGIESNVYFFYGGHGIMELTTYVVCPRFDRNRPQEWRFPVELELKKLSRVNGCYVVSVLDCCRERWVTKDDRYKLPAEEEPTGDRNLILTFGCPPNCTVDANSLISV